MIENEDMGSGVEVLDPDLAWEVYKSLEEDFINYLRFVPLADEHDNVWSLHLGDLLIRIGSILDSFFRRAIFSTVLNTATNISTYRTLNDLRINMGTYREVFDPFYGLSSKKIYELRTFKSLTPFSNWSSNRSPDWWEAYNHVKHDRFKNKKEATLKSTLNALGGLFLLNVQHLETIPVLIDYNIIKSNYAKDYFKTLLLDREPLGGSMETVYAKTLLFGYVFELKERSFDENKVIKILSRSYRGF